MPLRRLIVSRRGWPAVLTVAALVAGGPAAVAQTAPATEKTPPPAATTAATTAAAPDKPVAPPVVPPPATRPVETNGTRTSAAINQALDQNLDLDQRNRPVGEVLDFLRRQTGIRFDVSDETYALLPYGRDTPITANAKNTPLRRTLEAITAKLGLTFVLGDDAIEIRPLPALRRAGRRTTVREISGFDLLANVRLDAIDDRQPAAKLLENVDLRLDQVDSDAKAENRPEPGFRIENRLGDGLRDAPVFVPRNATLLGALDAVAEQTDATWYPRGDGFVVVPKSVWVRRQLDESAVSHQYDGATVPQVLQDLQKAAGVSFTVEPGAIQRVPKEARKVQLSLANTSVRDALDALGGATGLGFIVNDTGVYVWNKDPNNPDARRTEGDDRPVLLVRLGDGTSMLLYASDLSDDQRARLAERRKRALDGLAAALDMAPAAVPPPASEPATRPVP